ncbi:MAG: type II/IV secretion system ATPase subunit [Thermoplasmata archaeon]|nr:type II/IV secretion system ATPase subunit [Thermoplasmata archaeon]MCI4340780.1 type II/IV secretion system ATPase subunit [Thermoplasmata archaeon]
MSTTFRVRIPHKVGPEGTGAPARIRRPATEEQDEEEAPVVDLPGTFITAMPPLPDVDCEQLEVNAVTPPYSYSRVTYNDRTKEYLYEAIEPQLSGHERELLDHLKSTLTQIIGSEVASLSAPEKRSFLRGEVETYLATRGITLSPLSTERMIYYIQRDFVGFGPVDVLIADPLIEDISCDGVEVPLFVFHSKYESVRTDVAFPTEESLNSFVIMLGQRCGKAVSVSSPILDGTTVEGHRVQATYGREVTTRGGSFTIRRFKEKPFTPVDLILNGSASEEMIAYFWLAAEQGESLIICGGPAAGKTSTLNAIALFIPPTSKIVSIEDTREVNLPHENWIPGATRSGTGDRGPDGKAAGEVDMFDLVRAALRQRPNYIIVGEVRGKETYTMFQAMATGHTTYSTMHADSVKSMVNRLENPPINTPRILLSALNNVIIQIQARTEKGVVRRLKQVLEIVGFEPETNELITNTVYEWDPGSDKFTFKGHSFLFDKIMEIKNFTHEEMDAEFQRRVGVIHHLVSKGINDHRQLWRLISGYYKDPEEVMRRITEAAA